MRRTIFIFWHRKIDTEKVVHTGCTKKIHTEFFVRRNLTQKSFYTAETFPHRNLSGQILLNAQQFYRGMGFTQKVLRAEVLRTEGFTHNILYRLSYTDAFTRKTNCTQHTSTRNQLLHREVLLPLLDHLPFVFPLSSMPWGMVINPLIGMYIVHDEDFHYEMSDHITTIRQLIIYIPLYSSLLVDYIPLQNYIPIKHANGHMHADSMLPCQGVGT